MADDQVVAYEHGILYDVGWFDGWVGVLHSPTGTPSVHVQPVVVVPVHATAQRDGGAIAMPCGVDAVTQGGRQRAWVRVLRSKSGVPRIRRRPRGFAVRTHENVACGVELDVTVGSGRKRAWVGVFRAEARRTPTACPYIRASAGCADDAVVVHAELDVERRDRGGAWACELGAEPVVPRPRVNEVGVLAACGNRIVAVAELATATATAEQRARGGVRRAEA